MAEIIRRIEEDDFKEVSDLFLENGILEEGNTVEELMWLFTDPECPEQYNAFVALNDQNSIIGVIGYTLSNYIQGADTFLGMTPFSWKLKSGYKGLAGVSLFKKVSEFGDIKIAIGGTNIASKLYPLFKYKFLNRSNKYYKILNIPNYYKTLKGRSFRKRISNIGYLIPSYFKNTRQKSLYKDISLVPYMQNNFVEDDHSANVLRKKLTRPYLDWQMRCPRLKVHAFVLKRGNDNLGMCVLSVQKFDSTFKGRIIHLPFLGDDLILWNSVINQCLEFLKDQGCCFVSGLAINDTYKSGLIQSGFITIESHVETIYAKDGNREIAQFDYRNWHFQYSEGDIGFMDL